MSLDGFIVPPDDRVEWMFGHGKPGPAAQQIIHATGAILAGRCGCDIGIGFGGGLRSIYGGAWSGPLFVLTHRPSDPPEGPNTTFLSDGIESAVSTAQAAAGDKSVGIVGASIARQCLEHGLLDQLIVHLPAVLLGEGDAPGVGPIRLERTRAF
jgi:hypothetical protein